MNAKTTYVSTIGLNARSIKTFEFFFKKNYQEKYVLCDSHRDASITLVDIDALESESELTTLQDKNPENTFICLSTTENKHHNTFHIKKPINSAALIELLEKIEKNIADDNNEENTAHEENASLKLVARENSNPFNQRETALAGKHLGGNGDTDFFGEQKDIDTTSKKELTKALYYPEKMLQGAIAEAYIIAKKNECAVQLTILGISIIIDPINFKVYTTLADSIIRPTCFLETNKKAEFEQLDAHQLKSKLDLLTSNASTESNGIDIDTFIWKITLWSSRGRIPSDTDLSTPVYLKHWPNLTRLVNIPHAPRIAALLISAPDTLIHIAERLNIPQRYVFGFYSASHALDLSANARRQVDTLFEPIEKPLSHSRSVLGKLFRHITRKSKAVDPTHKINSKK